MTAVAEHRVLCMSNFKWLNEDTGQVEPAGLPCDCAKAADWALVPVPFIEKLKESRVAKPRLCTGCLASMENGLMFHEPACEVAYLHRPPGWPGANPFDQ